MFWAYRADGVEIWLTKTEAERRRHHFRTRMREKVADPEWYIARQAEKSRIYHDADYRPVMLRSAKIRAAAKGLPFDLTLDDLPLLTHCPVFGLEFKRSRRGESRDATPTLDEIVRGRGYVRGNVVVVSHLANLIKNKATIEQLVQVAKFYEMIGEV